MAQCIVKNCDGIPTWVVGSCPFIIGDTGPAGGKVFYLTDATGEHGLEAAPEDLGGAEWGCNGIAVNGTSTAIGTGKANTEAINAVCELGTAAALAASYSLNGVSDWYLPSFDELNLLYEQKTVLPTSYLFNYWSSTQYSMNFNYIIYMPFGVVYKGSTGSTIIARVRAVRTF